MMLKAAVKFVVLGLAALAWLPAATVARAVVSVDHPLPHPDPGRPIRLSLLGLPPAPCPYRLEQASSAGDTLLLRLAHADGCAAQASGQALAVQPQGMTWGRKGVVRVRVEDARGAGGTPRLLGFGLVQVGRVSRTTHPEAGYWWNEAGGDFDRAGPGLGLNLERQGDTLSVTVLGYAADGRPEWLFGAGPIHGQLARVPLSRLQGGAGPFDPWQAPGEAEPAGVVHFEFLSGARAVAWFERSLGEAISLQPLSLVRFRFDERPSEAALGEWLFVGGIALGDAATRAQALQFVRSEQGEDGFRLHGAAGDPTLGCELDRERPNSPPSRCVLSDANGTLLVDFVDIALGRMRGYRPDGAAVTAVHRPAD
jgi:hypothetical protein